MLTRTAARRGEMRPSVTRTSSRARNCFTCMGGRTLGGQAEEVGREVLGVVVSRAEGEFGSGLQGEVADAETVPRIRSGKAAALVIGKAMLTA